MAATTTHAERVDKLVDAEMQDAKATNPHQRTLDDLEREAQLRLTSGSSTSPSRLQPSPTVAQNDRSFAEALRVVREWTAAATENGRTAASESGPAALRKIETLGIQFWDSWRARWAGLALSNEQLAIAYHRYHAFTIDGIAPRIKHRRTFAGFGLSEETLEDCFSYDMA